MKIINTKVRVEVTSEERKRGMENRRGIQETLTVSQMSNFLNTLRQIK